MEKVINLLNSEKQHLTHQISFLIDEIETGKAAIKDLQSPEFVERNKDRECWSEDWTIQDFIELNVNANNRAIESHSKRLAEKKDYLSQIESVEDFGGGITMTNGKYVLVQKTVSKVTDETKNEELLVSDDIMDILNRLIEELKIDHEHYCSIEMTDAKSFVSETFDRTYIYSIYFKKDPEVMKYKEEEGSSTHCETCKNYESTSDITGWCSACPGTVIKDMNANNTCAAYEKREK